VVGRCGPAAAMRLHGLALTRWCAGARADVFPAQSPWCCPGLQEGSGGAASRFPWAMRGPGLGSLMIFPLALDTRRGPPGDRFRRGHAVPRTACQPRTLSAICPCTAGNSRTPMDTARHRRAQSNSPQDRETQATGYLRRWWQVLGSNQRRRSRRFYRPLPLAARATCLVPLQDGTVKDSGPSGACGTCRSPSGPCTTRPGGSGRDWRRRLPRASGGWKGQCRPVPRPKRTRGTGRTAGR
jgi:hypothetical protein